MSFKLLAIDKRPKSCEESIDQRCSNIIKTWDSANTLTYKRVTGLLAVKRFITITKFWFQILVAENVLDNIKSEKDCD